MKKLIESLTAQALDDVLLEFRKKNVRVLLNGKEVPFGSDTHMADLRRTLVGLERLRDCYEQGSGNRLVFSQACSRIRKLIRTFIEKSKPTEPA